MMIAGCYLGGYHEDSAAYSWLEPLSTSLQLLAPEANIQVVYTGFAAALVSLLTCLAAVIGNDLFALRFLHPIRRYAVDQAIGRLRSGVVC